MLNNHKILEVVSEGRNFLTSTDHAMNACDMDAVLEALDLSGMFDVIHQRVSRILVVLPCKILQGLSDLVLAPFLL